MKILVLTNFSMGLYKFRKELLSELIRRNHKVYISLPEDDFTGELTNMGCEFVNTTLDRRGKNPFKDLALLVQYVKMLVKIKPDVVLTYTIKPNIYGGLACRITKTKYISNITGIGTSMSTENLVQKLTILLYRIGLKDSSCLFFQNSSNRSFFSAEKIVGKKSELIPGSGVNLEEFIEVDYPDEDDRISILFVGRLMKAKGVDELLEAAIKIKDIYPNVQFDVVGSCEDEYLHRLDEIVNSKTINYHGHQDDVKPFIKRAHALILPSYHEGTANVLLEAAASGRPILASRIPGCQEAFDEDISGIGFESRQIDSLVTAINKFIELPYDQKKRMGKAGRKKMEENFNRNLVVKAYLTEINKLGSN